MTVLDVVQLGHPALRRKARSVSTSEIVSPQMQEIVDNMVETMHSALGVGLSGPQVDVNVRLFVAEAHPNERRPNIEDMELMVVFNPEITVVDSTWNSDWEGCLSIDRGDMMGLVKRFQRVRVEGLDRMGQPIMHELEDFHARIIQHEVDHLEGILFFDRIYERREKQEEIVLATFDNYQRFFNKDIESRDASLEKA